MERLYARQRALKAHIVWQVKRQMPDLITASSTFNEGSNAVGLHNESLDACRAIAVEPASVPPKPWRYRKAQYSGRLEYAQKRSLRVRNKHHYRLAHWPLWIIVFFLAPGFSAFALFDHGLGRLNGLWLLVVLVGTGVAGWQGLLPGMERKPYILRFDEDKSNPIYRRVCYAFAWNAVLSFALLNFAGVLVAAATGHGLIRQVYQYGYPPLCALILLCGAAGLLPRAGASTKGEGLERRYFYSFVWAVTSAQILLLLVWKMQWESAIANPAKLCVFTLVLLLVAYAALRGKLPRTRPIIGKVDNTHL